MERRLLSKVQKTMEMPGRRMEKGAIYPPNTKLRRSGFDQNADDMVYYTVFFPKAQYGFRDQQPVSRGCRQACFFILIDPSLNGKPFPEPLTPRPAALQGEHGGR